MRSLERTVEWLRPLVATKTWDYCIVWKFGDDPSRFFEWVGCCCGGSTKGDCKNVKEENGNENHHLLTLCKDTFIKHSARTIACEKLAKSPFSFPLYSGVHGEVAMSNQPRWLSHESNGTQVLIPVESAMIELFSGKFVPKDQNIIDLIMAQFSTFVEHEKPRDPFLEEHKNVPKDQKIIDLIMAQLSTFVEHEKPRDPSLEEHKNVQTYSLPYLNFIPSLQAHSLVSIEGSSTGSTPSSSLHVSPTQSGKSLDLMGCENSAIGKRKLKAMQRTGKEQFHSKNLVTERNRRTRIKDGLFALRALVPNITKMDRAAILGDAIDYIHEVLKKNAELQDEFCILKEEEEYNNSTIKFELPKRKRAYEAMNNSPTAHSGGSTVAAKQIGVQVEVNQIGSRDFLLRLVYNQNRGEFTKILETVNSLGLQVTDVNVATYNGRVLNILKAEAKEKEVEVEPKKLKDSLLKTWSSQTPEEHAH